MKEPTLSLVVPCFNEQEAIRKFYEEANRVLAQMNLDACAEFVFVDDGSLDGTLETIKELLGKDKRVRFMSFSRNFGKEAALQAGLAKASGQFTAVMDADLQAPPSLLPQMLDALLKEGFDCTATRRTTRKNEPLV